MPQHYPDGTLIKGTGDKVYVIEGGQKLWIPNPSQFNSLGFDFGNVITVDDVELNTIPTNPSLPSGTVVKGRGERVYVIEGGQKRWIPNQAAFGALGFSPGDIVNLNDAELNAMPDGTIMPGGDVGGLGGDQEIIPPFLLNPTFYDFATFPYQYGLDNFAVVSMALALAGGILAYWVLRLKGRFTLPAIVAWGLLYGVFVFVVVL